MSVWPQQVISSRTAGSQAWQGAHFHPLFWLLLAGIVVIGIVIGLFATSITASLLSNSAAQAGDPVGGTVLPHLGTLSARIASL